MTDPASSSSSSAPAAKPATDWLHGDGRPWWRRPAPWIAAALVAALAAGGVAWQRSSARKAVPQYVTETVVRGDLSLTVTANGTLQPTRTVSIGSELSGTVALVRADVNDVVKKGQVLVELDTTKLVAQITKSRATLASARAAVALASATGVEAQAALRRLEEVRRLSGGKLPAETELDTARAAVARAQANEQSARAGVTEAQATLTTDETNLSKASIRAPIDGVILTRTVEPGQAVAASLQAVTLFTMAEDLTRLKLSVAVDEADVAQVRSQQTANFTVSAWPGRRYPATIHRVAYASTITDNVVTYATELEVANDDRSLRPGMTATATIAATEHKGVLLVPNTALGFAPASAKAKPANGGGSGIVDKIMMRPPGSNTPRRAGTSSKPGSAGSRQVWVLQDGQPTALPVTVGLSNGRVSEVTGEGIAEGMAVITEQRSGGTP